MDLRGLEVGPGHLHGYDIEDIIPISECMPVQHVSDGRVVGRRHGFRMRGGKDEVLDFSLCTGDVGHLAQDTLAQGVRILVVVGHLVPVEKEAAFLDAAI
jgi:hypothetical protein